MTGEERREMVMKKRSLMILGVLATIVVLTLLASGQSSFAQQKGTLQEVLKRGVLRVGAPISPPWYMKDLKTGEWSGICSDFYKQVGEYLGVKVEFVETTWGNAIAGLQANKFDTIAAFSARPKRALAVDFAYPIGMQIAGIMGPKEKLAKFDTWQDINKPSVTISANKGAGTTAEAKALAPNATYREMPSKDTMFMELVSGRVDAVISTRASLLMYRDKTKADYEIKILHPTAGTPLGVAMRKESNPEFREWMNHVIRYMRLQKVLTQIWDRYVPGGYIEVR